MEETLLPSTFAWCCPKSAQSSQSWPICHPCNRICGPTIHTLKSWERIPMKTDTLQVQHDAVKPSCWQQLSGHSPGEHSTAEHSPAGHSPVGHFSNWAPEPDIGVVKSSAQLSHRRSKVVMLADNSSLPPAGPASNRTLSKFNTAQ